MSIYAGKPVTTRCPKCQSTNFRTMEVYEEIVTCSVQDGIFPKEADDHTPGRILGISCECDRCGHGWRPRGAKSLSDIIEDTD